MYQVGKDANSNDDTRTEWRVHDVSIKERYAAVAGIKSSTFELAHEFEVTSNEDIDEDPVSPDEESSVTSDVLQDSTKIISEYKENIVSLLEYHEDVDEQLVNDLFEKYKNEPDISTMINNILLEINQNTIAYDLVLLDGKIDVEQKSDGSNPADIDNGVEKVGDVIKIEIDNVDKIITFSEDSDGKMTMMIEVDDPNVESLELPSDFVNGVRNALQTINPN